MNLKTFELSVIQEPCKVPKASHLNYKYPEPAYTEFINALNKKCSGQDSDMLFMTRVMINENSAATPCQK